ncbi:MAG: SPOR domain-containing protein [Candidatus Omnitrophica bacterium]|nr:SPOR domain-containing protein [Candidatus Omnitrophota bacterium]
MFLFQKKKKEENLRPLSERDIQEKLYGHIRRKSPAEDSITVSTEQPATFNELFSPAVNEAPAPVKPADPSPQNFRQPEPRPAAVKVEKVKPPKPEFKMPAWPSIRLPKVSLPKISVPKISLPKITWPRIAAPKFDMPKPTLPRFKKPRWIEKIEQIPLPMVAAALFVAVILLVVSRAVAQGVFKGASGFRLIKVVRPESPRPRELAPPVQPLKPDVTAAKPAEAAPAPRPEVRAAAVPAVPKKFYTIQVIVYEDEAHAEAMIGRLKERKLDPFYRSIKTSRGKERFQVFVGHFKDYSEAQNHLGRYKKSGQLQDFADSFVRPQVE